MIPTKPTYNKSHALVIGINKYSHASPLMFAVNDANAVADTLSNDLGFASVKLLTDANATRTDIHREFLAFAGENTDIDDRLIVFFAGHGHTERDRRGEVGYLVPFDGCTNDLSTLLRWDTLTRDAELISAKHILFIMDACYGGLAITRSLKSGASRFLKDMLQRCSRQVLSAGKADELVSDSGGPRVGHSIFTGHFLDAISGAAAVNGIISANGVMAYVYQHVGADPDSTQTPHYGYLNGDGDFIFNLSKIDQVEDDANKNIDTLISVPGDPHSDGDARPSTVEKVKTFLATPDSRIKLHDLVSEITRGALYKTSSDLFPLQGSWTPAEFSSRLERYNKSTEELQTAQMLLGFWGNEIHQETISLASKRVAEKITLEGGLSIWLKLRWYPVLLLIYSCGLGALASQKYSNLLSLLHARIYSPTQQTTTSTIVKAAFHETTGLIDAFKSLPGHERQYVPFSEYLFNKLQPMADDILFVGGDYDSLFDRLEILISLECEFVSGGRGPLGRFCWKHSSYRMDSPLDAIISEAEQFGSNWMPIKAGFFGGSIDKFRRVADGFKASVERLNWR